MARAGAIGWARLPDDDALAELEAAAADAFGAAASHVCATPGSEIALRLLRAIDLPKPWRHVSPGYRTHGEALPGSRTVAPERIADVTDGTLILAGPSNPQGALPRLPVGPRVVIDAAYADALGAGVPAPPDAITLRSFGKFFGLAGVRLGFMIAPPGDIAVLRERLGSWPVSAAAIAIGTAAYRDTAWQAAMRLHLVEEAAALDAVLRRHGFRPEGACPLFRLIRIPDAAGLFTRLAARGILARPFDHDPDWLRIGLPGEGLGRLDAALGNG